MLRKLFLLLLLFAGMATPAHSQIQIESAGLTMDYQINKMYVDPLDSSLWVAANSMKVNGINVPKGMMRLNSQGQVLSFPNCPYGSNTTMVRWNGNMFVGGYEGLSRFDGTRWYKIDSQRKMHVNTLYVYQGQLLVGGYVDTPNKPFPFSYDLLLQSYQLGTDTLQDFHRLDTLVPGDGMVMAMAEYKGKLYVGGNFNPDTPSNYYRNDIVYWDDTAWSALGHGLSDTFISPYSSASFRNQVTSLAVYQDTLYVGGVMSTYNAAMGNGFARWDGTQWAAVNNTGIPYGEVLDLKVYAGGLAVMGHYSIFNYMPASGIAFYKGGNWCFNNSSPSVVITGVDYGGAFWVGTSRSVGLDTVQYVARIRNLPSCAPVGGLAGSIAKEDLGVYPNPSTDVFFIRNPAATAVVSYQVTDLLGRTRWHAQSRQAEVRVEAAAWPAGIYLLRIRLPDGSMQTEKLVKQ